jgi:TIR domain
MQLWKREKRKRPNKIFISYSRNDAVFIWPFAEALSVTGAEIFLDKFSIHPGDEWEQRIDHALQASDIVFVFWTKAASTSREVKKEYEKAYDLGKRIVPVLFDDIRLPPKLDRYQAIKFNEKAPLNNVEQFITMASKFIEQIPEPQDRIEPTRFRFGLSLHSLS